MNPSRASSEAFEPGYVKLHASGELATRAHLAREKISPCTLCPRNCSTKRSEGEPGFCRIGDQPTVSSYGTHLGEERVLVGRYGSGTVFFTGCNLGCEFCPNYEISHLRRGEVVSAAELAGMMLDLQGRGCHNINFVTPTHQVPQIIDAVIIAAERGLRIPLVYNCGGYESVEVLKLLDGVVDIYMPDIKYGDNAAGERYSQVPDYWDRCREAVLEMHRQVGDMELRDARGESGAAAAVAVRGLLVRHLVMPERQASTDNVMAFLADEVSKNTHVNVLAQYRPEFNAHRFSEIDRCITADEFQEALAAARSAGLYNLID